MRYQKVHASFWRDEKVVRLSEKGKILFLYLMTGPHNNILGAYVLPKKYLQADLSWSARAANVAFNELVSRGLVTYDESVNLLVIPKQLKHNTLENPNQIKAAVKVLDSLPTSGLYLEIIETLEQFGKPFTEQLTIELGQRLPKPETETAAGEEKETGSEGSEEGTKTTPPPPPHEGEEPLVTKNQPKKRASNEGLSPAEAVFFSTVNGGRL